MKAPAVMVNILGDAWKWENGTPAAAPNWPAILGSSRAKLHLYGKSEPRVGRKMGHFTVLADTIDAALEKARALKAKL
jgi:5-(carboxyamino)imidazole ribonucleotide synthase